MKRYLSSTLLLILLVSCTREPPAYESHYVPPTAASLPPASSSVRAVTPPEALQASFIDTFDRPDTELGLGEGWDMRGPQKNVLPLPAATDGFIKDGRFTYAGTSVVYAARQFRGPVRSVGTSGRFRKTGVGSETTLSMAVTADDQLNTNMVHFAANRSGWLVEVRRGKGVFRLVATGQFSPMLDLDRDYNFGFEADDNAVTVSVPGKVITKNAPTLGLTGDRAFWQEYPKRLPVGVVFDFDTVWAVEDGQPVFPFPRQP